MRIDFTGNCPFALGAGLQAEQAGILRRLARSINGRYLPVDARKVRRTSQLIAPEVWP